MQTDASERFRIRPHEDDPGERPTTGYPVRPKRRASWILRGTRRLPLPGDRDGPSWSSSGKPADRRLTGVSKGSYSDRRDFATGAASGIFSGERPSILRSSAHADGMSCLLRGNGHCTAISRGPPKLPATLWSNWTRCSARPPERMRRDNPAQGPGFGVPLSLSHLANEEVTPPHLGISIFGSPFP